MLMNPVITLLSGLLIMFILYYDVSLSIVLDLASFEDNWILNSTK
jgi:hypothetical protein